MVTMVQNLMSLFTSNPENKQLFKPVLKSVKANGINCRRNIKKIFHEFSR